MKHNLKLNSHTYNTYIKIPTQNNLREDEIRGATSIIGFLLSLIPVSDSSCNRLCDKGHSLENHVFFSHFQMDPTLQLSLLVFSNHKLSERETAIIFPSFIF